MLAARRWLSTLVTIGVAFMPAIPAAVADTGVAPAAGGAPMAAGQAGAPADSYRDSQQWVLDTLDVQNAWLVTKGAGVTVAVIDSGVDPYVSDLAGSVLPNSPDLTGLTTPPSSAHWGEHGTWMASIIAGHGHGYGDLSGITGIAPAAKILSIRVIPDKDDPGYRQYEAEPEAQIQQSLAEGIRDAVHDGAQVISMSIGYSSPSAAVRSAVEYAYQSGVVLVASSGNSGHDELHNGGLAPESFPADYPGVLSVGALNRDGAVASFSSNNLSVQVTAPGVKVPAQGRDGLYWTVDGTSPACALVAGAAALIKARYPGLSPALVIDALTSTAKNGSGKHNAYNPRTGFGTVDATAALGDAKILARRRAEGSQVAPSAMFGGGPAAIPAAPVSPRGAGQLVLFTMLAILSLALIVAASVWLAVLRRPRTGAHAAGPPYRPGYPPGQGYPPGGYPPPGPAR